MHSQPDGSPLEAGGPLRAHFPAGVAVQDSICKGAPQPVSLKGLVQLVVSAGQ